MDPKKAVIYLLIVTTCALLLLRATPAVIELANALVPLVLTVGAVTAVLRLVWHYTRGD